MAKPTEAQMLVLRRIARGGGLTLAQYRGSTCYIVRDNSGLIVPEKIVEQLTKLGALLRDDGGVFPERPRSYRVRAPQDGRR